MRSLVQPPRQVRSQGHFFAFLGEGGLQLAELSLLGGVQHIDQPVFHDVTQPPLGIDEEITSINITVVFDDRIHATLPQESAFRRRKVHIYVEERIEEADGCGCSISPEIPPPQIEYLAEEFSVFFWRDREGGGLRRIVRIELQAGNKLHVVQSERFMERIDFLRIVHRAVIDHGEGIGRHAFVREEKMDCRSGILTLLSWRGRTQRIKLLTILQK